MFSKCNSSEAITGAEKICAAVSKPVGFFFPAGELSIKRVGHKCKHSLYQLDTISHKRSCLMRLKKNKQMLKQS